MEILERKQQISILQARFRKKTGHEKKQQDDRIRSAKPKEQEEKREGFWGSYSRCVSFLPPKDRPPEYVFIPCVSVFPHAKDALPPESLPNRKPTIQTKPRTRHSQRIEKQKRKRKKKTKITSRNEHRLQ